ncbi:MAG: hypothetical protein DSY43_03885 [Gammaproteobacteria bacterium]|nr:MAG: hypothetical protein DSY43_03885 [Gammaproteobacteria bacterium]
MNSKKNIKYISLVVDKVYQNNKIFNHDPAKTKYRALKDEFLKLGYEINTHDLNENRDVEIAIYFDIPNNFLNVFNTNIRNYALLMESPLSKNNNFNHTLYQYFDKIFTWSNDLIKIYQEQKKFVKINYSFDFGVYQPVNIKQKERLCALINGNHASNAKDELYSKRVEIIRWFEEYHPNDFDLYGRSWNDTNSRYGWLNKLTSYRMVAKIYLKMRGRHFHPAYCGTVKNKISVLSKYKFSVAFENVQNASGYITEKIFDVFFSNCVPIYLGANDICEVIPKNCFIDMRDFNDYESLYFYIKNMTDDDYIQYLNHIQNFLFSAASDKFKIETFVDTVINGVLDDKKYK